jgi:DNA mismatch repair ATPase MutS
MKQAELSEKYLTMAEEYRLLEKREEKILFYLSVLRFLSFTGGAALIWAGFTFNKTAGILIIPAVIVLFLWLLRLWSLHNDKKDFFCNLSIICRNEAAASSGNITSFEPGDQYRDISHDFSNDVDLFGESSLFQYLNRTVSGFGRDILAGWLSDPYPLSSNLKLRQDAIKELAAKVSWRHEFMARGMKEPLEKNDIRSLMQWMDETSKEGPSRAKKVLVFLLPAITLSALFLLITGVLHYSFFTTLFLVNLLFISTGLKETNKVHNALSKKYSFLSSLIDLLKLFNNEQFSSSVLKEIREKISGGDGSASASVKKLGSIIQAFDTRLNFFVAIILNGLILWDYQCLIRLEKWKSENKNRLPVWLEAIGTIDAFISLGNYTYNNQEFAFPGLSPDKVLLSAESLGHQLIDENRRVCNDFSLSHQGLICIISGANMAGKSTFLRTVAVNYILAMAGAPVCASSMSFVPLRLFTSMRTTDSLSNNESYFYAELRRLKTLKSRIASGERMLFILDEILKGTNSADKSMGSRLFLQQMVNLGASGMIATHDTSLGDMEMENPGVVINRCFEIEIDGETVLFDYKLREGITKKMNAALLMKQMGIL